MKNIAILTKSCKYFAAPFLAEALNADLYAIDHSQNRFFPHDIEVKKFNRNKKIPCKNLIIIGTRALQYCHKQLEKKEYESVAVIFSDTNCCRMYKWWNEFVKKNNIAVYIMPDLIDYCFVEYKPIFQTIRIPDNIKKRKRNNKNIIISHSPGMKEDFKGSNDIEKVIERLKIDFPITYIKCNNLNWKECLEIKALSYIFIDQLTYVNPNIPQKRFGGEIPYNGALGKSGLEAMLLRCCVVSGCKPLKTEPHFPGPPIVYTDYYNFENDLKLLIENKENRINIAENCESWAKEYLSPEFISKYVTSHITGKQQLSKYYDNTSGFFDNKDLQEDEQFE